MTFELPVRTAEVVFEGDHRLAGLTITARVSIPMSVYWDLLRVGEATDEAELRRLFLSFGEHCLIDWNLTRNGERIEPTPEAFADELDLDTASTVMARVLSAVGRVPLPLAPKSASGGTSKGRKASKSPST